MLGHPSNGVEVGFSLCEPSYRFRTCLCFFHRSGWILYLGDRLLLIGADSVWVIASSADRGQSLLCFGRLPLLPTEVGLLLCFGRLPLLPTEVGLFL